MYVCMHACIHVCYRQAGRQAAGRQAGGWVGRYSMFVLCLWGAYVCVNRLNGSYKSNWQVVCLETKCLLRCSTIYIIKYKVIITYRT